MRLPKRDQQKLLYLYEGVQSNNLSQGSAQEKELKDVKNWRKIILSKVPDIAGHDDEESMKNHIYSMSSKAYSKLYRFHVLEYKLHLLSTEYALSEGVDRLIDFTKYEISNLFDWLKEWMLGVLETRIYANSGSKESNDQNTQWFQNKLQDTQIDTPSQRIPGTKKEKGVPWQSILTSYKRLSNATSLQEKILAITLSLNAWHDNGGIFGISSKIADEEMDELVWMFAPLTMEQFDALDSINPAKVKREIEKELSL